MSAYTRSLMSVLLERGREQQGKVQELRKSRKSTRSIPGGVDTPKEQSTDISITAGSHVLLFGLIFVLNKTHEAEVRSVDYSFFNSFKDRITDRVN